MIYKLQDGDELKIFPIFGKDGTFKPIIETKCLYLPEDKIVVYDYKNYLSRILLQHFYNTGTKTSNCMTKYFILIYHDNELKYVQIGKTLMDIIKDYKFDPRNDYHLKIDIKMKDVGGMLLPSYEKSEIITKKWIKPIENIESQEDWKKFLLEKQPYYIEDFIEERNILSNIKYMKKKFGDSFLSDLIVENRENKLNKLLYRINFSIKE